MTITFESIDEAVRAVRADCEAQIKAMADKLLAAEIEASMAKEQLTRAVHAKEDAIQITSRLIERFSIAEEAFAQAKKYALTLEQPAAGTALPPNDYGTQEND